MDHTRQRRKTLRRVDVAIATSLALLLSAPANADCRVGNRIFATPLAVDDPCVDDELSVSIARFKDGSNPPAVESEISGEYFKSITENFGVSLDENWIRRQVPGDDTREGFDNLGTTFLYQFITDAQDELVVSVALDVSWGGTGNRAVGADAFTTLTPTWLAGKGLGSLPDSMKLLRPFGVTAQIGYSVPTESTTAFDLGGGVLTMTRNPQFLVWGGSLQYSMPYLKSHVADFDFPSIVNHLVPLIEVNLETQTSNFDGRDPTIGTVNPGLFYTTDKYQLGAEAIIPVNRASGDGLGVIGNLHLYLEDISPHTLLGRPLFRGASEGTEN